jgi:hypothetical protein
VLHLPPAEGIPNNHINVSAIKQLGALPLPCIRCEGCAKAKLTASWSQRHASLLQVARVLNNITWQPLLECHHGTPVDELPGVAVYQEVEEQQRRVPLLPVQVGGCLCQQHDGVLCLHSFNGNYPSFDIHGCSVSG